jgi:hypothetical protein
MKSKPVRISSVHLGMESGKCIPSDTQEEIDFLNPGKLIPQINTNQICWAYVIEVETKTPAQTIRFAVLTGHTS